VGQHGDAQPLRWREFREDRFRQAAGFRPEDEDIAGLKAGVAVATAAPRGEGEQAALGEPLPTGIPVAVDDEARKLVVVQAGAPQRFVLQTEAQGLNQMQARAAIGAQADDVAGVGGGFPAGRERVRTLPCVLPGKGLVLPNQGYAA
jgi:hypothetical protein